MNEKIYIDKYLFPRAVNQEILPFSHADILLVH